MTARSGGMALRLSRLSRHSDGRYLFVPMDHSVGDGPIVAARDFNGLVRTAVAGGADAIVVHKGRAATVDPGLLRDCSLIVHLSASTSHATDVDAKVLVGDVEEAIQLGADAVSVHVNIGSDTESRQLTDLSSVADACGGGVCRCWPWCTRGGRGSPTRTTPGCSRTSSTWRRTLALPW